MLIHRLCLQLLVTLSVLANAVPLRADAARQIAQIEQLPRSRRLAAYESAADRRALSESDRVELIVAFAAHAKKLSVQFGRSTHEIDTDRWRQMLEYAWEREPGNRDLMLALTQLLIDEQEYEAALSVAEAFVEAFPNDHAANAWSRWCRDRSSSRERPAAQTFPLHFCVLTRNPAAHAAATREQCEQEVEILNAGFRDLNGEPLASFVLKGYSTWEDVRQSDSEFLEWGDAMQPYNSGKVVQAFNACTDPRVRDRNAINIYIYDSYNERAGYGDPTSHGTRNSNRPYLLLDWERLGGESQSAEVHEMGHCFGLWHVGVPGAGGSSSTNIMASAAEGFGSGGKRDLAFTEAQAAVIIYHGQRTSGRLGLDQ